MTPGHDGWSGVRRPMRHRGSPQRARVAARPRPQAQALALALGRRQARPPGRPPRPPSPAVQAAGSARPGRGWPGPDAGGGRRDGGRAAAAATGAPCRGHRNGDRLRPGSPRSRRCRAPVSGPARTLRRQGSAGPPAGPESPFAGADRPEIGCSPTPPAPDRPVDPAPAARPAAASGPGRATGASFMPPSPAGRCRRGPAPGRPARCRSRAGAIAAVPVPRRAPAASAAHAPP